MRVHVVADAADRDGGYVTERLREVGGVTVLVDRDAVPAFADEVRPELVVLLGSSRAAHDPAFADAVAAESAYVVDALDAGVPVIGICFGAQLLARALGGSSRRGAEPEIGWRLVDSDDPVLCPPGPWGQLHSDVLTPPDSARVLGTSKAGVQCFVDETRAARAIGWQFHPEVTATTYERWIGEDADDVRRVGLDPDRVVAEAYDEADASRRRAVRLVDDTLAWLGVATR